MADKRDRLLAELSEQGDRRQQARQSDRDALEAIEKLLPRAVAAGISKREIARRTGLSRTWIDELLARRDE